MKRQKQERELTEEERKVVVSVRHCARELDDILQGARRKSQLNSKIFTESGISVLFRGVDAYADMYYKLGVKSRDAYERLFQKYGECEEIKDTEDVIEETEGNWRNFLMNLDKEISNSGTNSDKHQINPLDYLFLPSFSFIDCITNREFNIQEFVYKYTCVYVTCQPSYWPDTAVLWRNSEINKARCDLSQFNLGYLVITWGPPDVVRSWAKQVHRITKWPVLCDKSGDFRRRFNFNSGFHCVWAAENLDFIGCRRVMYRYPVNPLVTNLKWKDCREIGGEFIMCRPALWSVDKTQSKPDTSQSTKIRSKRQNDDSSSFSSDDNDDEDSADQEKKTKPEELEAVKDKEAFHNNEIKICYIHRSLRISDIMPSGLIYQTALTCYARLHNTTESLVMDKIRRDRRLLIAPESARLQFESTSGLYYDPETALYYDSSRGYFYDSSNQMYYYWSQTENRYMPANAIIQSELIKAQVTELAIANAAHEKAVAEHQAAKLAAQRVAAQLAEIRANKDDYSAYAYSTCVLAQQQHQTSDPNYSTNVIPGGVMNTKIKEMNPTPVLTRPLVPYGYECGGRQTPPPPGL